MGRELPERDEPDIAAVPQLGDVLGGRIIERELSVADRLRQQRGLEHFAQRRQAEQRVGRDRTLGGTVGEAVVEEPSPAVHAQRHRDAAGAIGRHDRLDVPGYDPLGLAFGAGGRNDQQRRDRRCRREARRETNACRDGHLRSQTITVHVRFPSHSKAEHLSRRRGSVMAIGTSRVGKQTTNPRDIGFP